MPSETGQRTKSDPGEALPRVLIAEELKTLLPADPLPGYEPVWVAAAQPTPAGDYVGMVPLLSRRLGEEEFAALPQLRVVAQCAVGYDNIDLAAAGRRGIPVTNTPDVLTDATADLTWALILAVARRLKEGLGLLTGGEWEGWNPTQLMGLELKGATLGVVGAGRIGQAVGRRGLGFGMTLLYADERRQPAFEAATGARHRDLSDLLPESDVVTVHVPSTRETRGLFDEERFSLMKPGALFINTARGDIVNEEALLQALDRIPLAGAGLDVYAGEPRVPIELVSHPKVFALPHIGSATTHTRRAMAELAVRNARAVLAGEAPLTQVTP